MPLKRSCAHTPLLPAPFFPYILDCRWMLPQRAFFPVVKAHRCGASASARESQPTTPYFHCLFVPMESGRLMLIGCAWAGEEGA